MRTTREQLVVTVKRIAFILLLNAVLVSLWLLHVWMEK